MEKLFGIGLLSEIIEVSLKFETTMCKEQLGNTALFNTCTLLCHGNYFPFK
jgi:hypothetical protein